MLCNMKVSYELSLTYCLRMQNLKFEKSKWHQFSTCLMFVRSIKRKCETVYNIATNITPTIVLILCLLAASENQNNSNFKNICLIKGTVRHVPDMYAKFLKERKFQIMSYAPELIPTHI